MWALHAANPEHWIPIATITSFKRMREFASLGVEWVAKALSLSEELEVDETKTSVRRRTEVQEPKGQFERSIYAVRLPRFWHSSKFTMSRHRKGSGRKNPTLSKNWRNFSTNTARLTRSGCDAPIPRSSRFL
jgi:hypothetical protein